MELISSDFLLILELVVRYFTRFVDMWFASFSDWAEIDGTNDYDYVSGISDGKSFGSVFIN